MFIGELQLNVRFLPPPSSALEGLVPSAWGPVCSLAGHVSSWSWLGSALLLLGALSSGWDDMAPMMSVRPGVGLLSCDHQPSSLLWACVIFPTFLLYSLLFLRPGNCPVLAPSLIPKQRRFAHCFLQCLYCLDFYLINFFTVFVFFLRVPYVSGMVWILLPQNSYGPGVMPLGGRAPGRRLGHEGSVWPHECILCPYKRGPRELHHVRTQGADGHLWARK